MAHEVEQMMYVGATPWHKLGRKFVEAPSIEEAIVAAGLDWKVTTEKVFACQQPETASSLLEELPALATRRSDNGKILGVVGPQYTPLQNTEAFDFFRPFFAAKEATIDTAGSLREGKRVFVLAKLNRDPMEIVKGDVVEKYVLLSNSHDGTLAIRVGFTPIRVVCANTLALAIDSKASKLIRVRHTKNVVDNLEKMSEIMNLANAEFESTAEQFRLLSKKDIVLADLEKYVKLVFNTTKKITEAQGIENLENKRILKVVQPLFEKGMGNDLPGVRGTMWGAYNAVNEYLQYHRGEETNRLDNLWFGSAGELNRKALDVALTLAAA